MTFVSQNYTASANGRPVDFDDEEAQSCRLWLDEKGEILDCCKHTQAVFGYRQAELKGRHVSKLIPRLADIELVRKGAINPHLAFLSRCAVPFRLVKFDGRVVSGALFAYLVNAGVALTVTVIVRPMLY